MEVGEYKYEHIGSRGPYLNETKSEIEDELGTRMCDLVTEQGLNCDTYKVYTSDGYILQMFRIRQPNLPSNAKPVFLQHGFMADSTFWVVHKEQSLPFVLAN